MRVGMGRGFLSRVCVCVCVCVFGFLLLFSSPFVSVLAYYFIVVICVLILELFALMIFRFIVLEEV